MDKRPAEGSVHQLLVSGYASDGSGVARLEGMVVFVQGALRGELCSVRLVKVGRSAIWGCVEKVVTPSPARVVSDCPYSGACGGCQLRHMSYQEELEFKRTRVEDALRRIGGADIEVTDVESCLLQPDAAARLRRAVKDWMDRWQVPAYDERRRKGLIRHVYVRVNRAGESLLCLLVNGKSVPQERELVRLLRQAEPRLAGVVLGSNETHSNVILGDCYRTLWGADCLFDTLCGYRFRLSVPSFYQVNSDQAEVLYGKVLELAALTGTETVLDLYCGIGTISLVLAGRAGQVWGAEVVPQAVADAQENARRNGVGNARFLCADAGEASRRFRADGIRPQVVCVDPPRKGLSEDVVDTIARMEPRRVVYVSCDPGTLGRDIARFRRLGYSPGRALAVDLFPRTQHVETIVLLQREDP